MEAIQLMVSIWLVIQILIIVAFQQFLISLNDRFYYFEECQLFSLFIAQILSVEFDEFEKNALY